MTVDLCRHREYADKASRLMNMAVEIASLDKNRLRPDIGEVYLAYLIHEKGSTIGAYQAIDKYLNKLEEIKDVRLSKSELSDLMNKMTKGE